MYYMCRVHAEFGDKYKKKIPQIVELQQYKPMARSSKWNRIRFNVPRIDDNKNQTNQHKWVKHSRLQYQIIS